MKGRSVSVYKVAFASVIVLMSVLASPVRGKQMKQKNGKFELTSSAFINSQSIPALYTCDGRDVSPELSWKGVPPNTKSFVLICDDPDAPAGTWVHWILFNIPVTVMHIAQGARVADIGALSGTNSWKKKEWGGPCPPAGTHHYYFTLYAIDTTLTLKESATKNDIMAAIQNHTIATAQLMGTYKRKKI